MNGNPNQQGPGYPPQQPPQGPPAYQPQPVYQGQYPPQQAAYGAQYGMQNIQHAGLLKRFIALLIDSILLMIITVPISLALWGGGATGTLTSFEYTSTKFLLSTVISLVISLGYFIYMCFFLICMQIANSMTNGWIVFQYDCSMFILHTCNKIIV